LGALKAIQANGERNDLGHNQPILLHFEGCSFGMGGKFHAISPQMHICQIGGRFLQMVLEGANK
jgi:hypothetical protein